MTSFRFGVNFLDPGTREEWFGKCRRAEGLGYDVINVADHLGMPAPFPSLVLAGEVTERPRLGTFVLNAGFWNPVLLAREVATTDTLLGGRLDLGLGTGYVKAEFEAAGLPWETPGRKVDRLEAMVGELARLFADPEVRPRPFAASGPPLLIGGAGDRVLRLAAAHADIVGFTGARSGPDGELSLVGAAEFAERVAFFDRHAAGRTVEKNVLVQRVVVTDDREEAARGLAPYAPGMTLEEILELPTLLVGTHREIADRIRHLRDTYGIGYITVLEPMLEVFAPVIGELR
ncbi:TIGR03621 family F420-dependent LLM class oxidoreductase [Spongiactinospora sp. TRM90649]|uniref:TIGR03621 family F420-dependent LLM class oxidoreductase n=1 Tax=Spongiactinospora sp. TRM90649 TaxID=3031114 RepID=UPI0023F73C39|nr:TIGR03621 family F420-dependent LLM class oxidoreductase [Spongiactinospora sp. TRM90649]MDF5756788.1 TIGR03621 family F420-dependent LLM class oxidoreductase [Spongiactinospora sp. TRM90649]